MLNLKIVGFIPNVDRKGSYPEFGRKPDCPVVALKTITQRAPAIAERVVDVKTLNQLKYKKSMIRGWKKTHRGYKPQIVDTSSIN